MFKKQCKRCRKVSYSLSSAGRWICPRCGADITSAPLMAQSAWMANILPVRGKEMTRVDLN